MPQIAPDLWLEGAYYIDFDHHGQLRIVGPHNHLHFGGVGLSREQISITKVASNPQGQLIISGSFKDHKLVLADPAIGHIRKVRNYIEVPGSQGKSSPTFAEVMRAHPAALSPSYIGLSSTANHPELIFRRYYGDHWYGVTFRFFPGTRVERVEKRRRSQLEADRPIEFVLTADTDERLKPGVEKVVEHAVVPDLQGELDAPSVRDLLKLTAAEVTHLVAYNKTAGFSYGTVFPRDWMESADLGRGDLTDAARLYMYRKSLEHTDEHGRGWHEDIVGEFASEKTEEVEVVEDDLDALVDRSSKLSQELKGLIKRIQQLYVNRTMIDIEPRYLLGLRHLGMQSFNPGEADHLRRVASYVLEQAEQHSLMTFKKIPAMLRRTAEEEFSSAGNWRDSERAFKMVHPIIAPFDVNVVFYPQALKLMAENAKSLGLDHARVERAVAKWDRVKDWFRFTNSDGMTAYALALYDVMEEGTDLQYRRLEVNHTDEAYELFYGNPSEADVASFCRRLLDPHYFYTASGPLVVGANDGYNTTDYHGKVIWTKQTAWVVAGLAEQLVQHRHDWSAETGRLMYDGLMFSAQTSLHAFGILGAVPELHFDDDGTPKSYNEQPITEGPSNNVQLWSAVGARRIIRAFNDTAISEAAILTGKSSQLGR